MACEKDYSKAVIYTIRTDDGLYVGSTINFKERKGEHKKCIYNENYNCKLYKNIRANDGNYRIEMYKPFPCNDKRELRQEEDRIMMEMNANLNTNKAYISEEERKEEANKRAKEYYENNKDECNAKKRETVICECGCKSTRQHITRHRTSKKHLNLMKLLDDLQSPV